MIAAGAQPQVRLLDARAAGLDEAGLRQWAQGTTARADAPHVSRSYRYPYALAAWYTEPVGIDIERIEPLDGAFAELVCTDAERAKLARTPDASAFLTSLWCAKEALTKALGDPVRYDPRRVESPVLWAECPAGPWRALALDAPRGHTAWLCWRSPG